VTNVHSIVCITTEEMRSASSDKMEKKLDIQALFPVDSVTVGDATNRIFPISAERFVGVTLPCAALLILLTISSLQFWRPP